MRILSSVFVLLSTACAANVQPLDVGSTDASGVDAVSADTSEVVDASPEGDGGPTLDVSLVPDAGAMVDAGMTDAGMNDAGMADAGMNDAGMNDAGMNDAGMTDAGMSDAGTDAPAPRCGDGVLDPGETCDGDCPSACGDSMACTTDTLMGSAAACTARCVHTPVSTCLDGDGCCPTGCTSAFDDDCVCVPATCGTRSCGTIDDGCGHIVRCGPDCGTWTRVSRPPVAAGSFGLSNLGSGRVLFIDSPSGRTFEYTASTDTWLETETLGSGASLTRATYAGGGRVVAVNSTTTWEYDDATDHWTAFGAPPVRLQSASMAYAGPGRVLAFGTSTPDFTSVAATFLYNTSTHLWSELALSTQPPARALGDLAWLGEGRVLLTGGLGNATGTRPVLDDAWIFHTSTATWTAVADPANGGRRDEGVAYLSNGVVLTYGGKGWSGAAFGSQLFRRYSAATDTWTASTTGVLVSPGILYSNQLAHLSAGRVFMLEGLWSTSPTLRGYAWIYDEGTGVSDMLP